MAITCPRCGAEYDATLFEYDNWVRCPCGEEIEYPGEDLLGGHVVDADSPHTRKERPANEETGNIPRREPDRQ